MKQKNIKKIVIRIIGFLLLIIMLFLGVTRITYITRDKKNAHMQDEFMELPRKSVSVFFVGNSHSFCSINTDLLYEGYGLDSFMLSASGQSIAMSYYAIMEAIKYQTPDTVYLEMSYAIHDWDVINDEMSHMFFDGMPLDSIKVAVNDLIDEENRIYFYLPIGQYHSRFTSLTVEDYIYDYSYDITSTRGRFYSEYVYKMWEIKTISKEEKKDMPENIIYYMDKIVELCESNDINLILYTVPYGSTYDDLESTQTLYNSQRIYNGIADYAADNNIEYYNLFWEVDQIGLDYDNDFMDSQHFNCNGQDKFTKYMVEQGYIKL